MFNITIANVNSINQSLIFISSSIINTIIKLAFNTFKNNTITSVLSIINSPNTSTSFSVSNTLFHSNIFHKKLFSLSHVNPTIEGKVSFIENTANYKFE